MNNLLSKKGVTPLISVILLLMITIALAGTAFVWITSISERSQSSAEGDISELERLASSSLIQLASNCSTTSYNITFLNNGDSRISAGTAVIVIRKGGETITTKTELSWPELTSGTIYDYNMTTGITLTAGQTYVASFNLPNNVIANADCTVR